MLKGEDDPGRTPEVEENRLASLTHARLWDCQKLSHLCRAVAFLLQVQTNQVQRLPTGHEVLLAKRVDKPAPGSATQ